MEKQQLEKYINEYGRDIYLFCKRLTQNKNTADDLYQETFLKLWELDNVNDTENPKSYLLGIAVNLWKNQCRKQMWRKQIADIVPVSEESQIENFSAADSVEDTVISNQEKVLVQDAVNRLPEKLRIVVLLYYMENLKVVEIAEQMHESVSSIKSKLMRARKYLRKELEDSVL